MTTTKPQLSLTILLFGTLTSLHPQRALDLDDCIKLAHTNNLKITSETLNREDDWKKLHYQIRNFLPEMSVTFSKSDSVSINAPDSRINKLGFSISQVLFNGGRNLADYRRARRELELRDLKAEEMRHEMTYQVSREYVEILKNREILKVQNQSLKNLEEQIHLAEMEYKQGGLTETDLLDIRIRGVQYSLNMQDTEEKLMQSCFNLAKLMNAPFNMDFTLKGTLNLDYRGIYNRKIIDDPSYISRLTALAEDVNIELMYSYLKETNARKDLLDSRICWIPGVEANGKLNFTGIDYPLNEMSFTLGLKMRFDTPLFPGSLSVSAGKANPDEHNSSVSAETSLLSNMEALSSSSMAKHKLSIADQNSDELKRLIAFRIDSLSKSVLLNYQRCSVCRQKIHLETEKLNIDKLKMSMGELTRLDYVKTELRLSSYKTDLIEAISTLYSNEMELEMSCGIKAGSDASLFKELIIDERSEESRK